MSIKIMLVDGQTLFRQGVKSLFERHSGMQVVAEAKNGLEAVSLAQQIKPQVIIINVILPEINGIDATRRIAASIPNVRIVALTISKSKRHVREMFDAGASGYVLLEAGFQDLEMAVEKAVGGQFHVSAEIGGMCVNEWMAASRNNAEYRSILTPREREVLQLLAEGNSSKGIASLHHVTPRTVDVQRRQIGKKLNIYNLADLIKFAIREGITPLD